MRFPTGCLNDGSPGAVRPTCRRAPASLSSGKTGNMSRSIQRSFACGVDCNSMRGARRPHYHAPARVGPGGGLAPRDRGARDQQLLGPWGFRAAHPGVLKIPGLRRHLRVLRDHPVEHPCRVHGPVVLGCGGGGGGGGAGTSVAASSDLPRRGARGG